MKRLRIKTLSGRMGGEGYDEGPFYPDYYGDSGSVPGSGNGIGPCYVKAGDCTTTLTGPLGVECCCYWTCAIGGQWKCTQGQYCAS
jgi:hypothetical protein